MKILLLIFFLLVSGTGLAQNYEEQIPWNEEERLVWQDFQGAPDLSSPFHANTSSGISFSWSLKTSGQDSEFNFDVYTSFYPLRSWIKGESGNKELLAHEQLHFDISEIYARKLKKVLTSYKMGSDVKRDIQKIYQKNEQAREATQKKYDLETNHGIKEEAQAKWEEFVKAELKSLKDFSD